MNSHSTAIGRALLIAAVLLVGTLVCASTLLAQYGNLNLNGNMNGTGTITVTRNINNNAAGTVSVQPTVRLTGNTTAQVQYVGNAGQRQINFTRLESWNNRDKTIRSTVQADILLFNNSFVRQFNLNGKQLIITDSIGNNAGVGSSVTLNSGRVVYSKASGSQYLFAGSYDTLVLSGAAAKYLRGATISDSINHTGGSFFVNNNLTVNSNYGASFATLAGVSAVLTLGNNRNSTIADLTVVSGGQVINGNNALGVTTLTGNAGTISALANGGPMTFSNPAVNAGSIAGGAGLLSFGSTLTQSTGSVTAGSGDVSFAGGVTVNGGSLVAANATDSLNFASTLTLNGGSTLAMTNGRATFNNAVAGSAANFNLGSGSVSYFNGNAAQNINSAVYGSLYITTSAAHTAAAGGLTVAGNLTLNNNVTVNAGDTLTMTSTTGSNVAGTSEVLGAVKRQHNFTGNTMYTFNRPGVALSLNQANSTNPWIAIKMTPNTDPVNTAGLPAQYVKRQYQVAKAGLAATDSVRDLNLYFLDSEIQNAGDVAKMGVRTYNGSWTKLTNPGGSYQRTVSGSPNDTVHTLNVSGSFAFTELGIAKTAFVTNKDNAVWSTANSWDEGSIPTLSDDAEIANIGVTLTAAGAQAASLTIDNGKALALSGTGALTVAAGITVGDLGDLTIGNGVSLTTNAGGISLQGASTLTVNGTMTINGGDLTTGTGAVTNNGTITVNE